MKNKNQFLKALIEQMQITIDTDLDCAIYMYYFGGDMAVPEINRLINKYIPEIAPEKIDIFLRKTKDDINLFLSKIKLDINSLNEKERDITSLVQEFLSEYFIISSGKIREYMRLPEIAEFRSVAPVNSAITAPVYIGNEYSENESENPYLKTLNFDHPYPLRADETGALKTSELLFLNFINNINDSINSNYEKLPQGFKYPVFITIGTTEREIAEKSENWLRSLIKQNCRTENIELFYITQSFFDKVFHEIILPDIKCCEPKIQEYIMSIYETGLCSYPNIRNFSELFIAIFLKAKYPEELCGIIEVDEDQLVEKEYCELLKKRGNSFLTLGLNGLGSLLSNGKTLSYQSGEYYKYNSGLKIEEAIFNSDVSASKELNVEFFYQKNNLYGKTIEILNELNSESSESYRHPCARGGLIFSLADSLLKHPVFCYDKITRGEDTARFITMFGETNEELRFIPMLKMAHNQSKSLKKLMKSKSADVAGVIKTFMSDIKRWKLKKEILKYYRRIGRQFKSNFAPYPAGMLDNIEARINLTVLLKLFSEQLFDKKIELIKEWIITDEYVRNCNVDKNYPLFLESMQIVADKLLIKDIGAYFE